MRYLGGKARIASQVADLINSEIVANGITQYVEPFVGAGWVLDKVVCIHKEASDANKDLILLWKALQAGWVPPDHVSKEEYDAQKEAEPSALRAFVGFGCSFSGKWFGGYAKDNSGRNYAGNAQRSLLKKLKNIDGVTFEHKRYTEVAASGALIYCDPPYAGTTGYSSVGEFDTPSFWNWVRATAKDNLVLVSEYSAPEDFECVLEIATKTDMKGANMDRVEKIFRKRA